MPQTIAFLGATGGCGLSTIARSLSASHTCLALCRTPSRLTTALEAHYPGTPTSTLTVIEGNALDEPSVSRALTHPADPGRLVDAVVFSIGGAFDAWRLANDDPHVCEKAMKVLLSAMDSMVDKTGGTYPRVISVSSTGISDKGRDVPLLLAPLYHVLLSAPHEDKRKMEELLRGGKGREWTLVRPTLLKDGVSKPKTEIRVGVENFETGVVERREVGYVITRDDVGRWMFENLVEGGGGEYLRKAVSLTT